MNKVPKISILIPTLNAASVLEKCFRSIANQDYPKEKIEVIVADGSKRVRQVRQASLLCRSEKDLLEKLKNITDKPIIFHNEAIFDLGKYLSKKKYYSKSFSTYI